MEKDQIPELLRDIWQNWEKEGGAGVCENCPSHWSIRDDFDREIEEDTSFGHRPYYGDGSLDPDIAIIAEEPGTPNKYDADKNHLNDSFIDVREAEVDSSIGGTIKRAESMFKKIKDSEFDSYFTQMKKCNELPDNYRLNEASQDQCCGVGSHKGYLKYELRAVSPDYIVTLGKDTLARFDTMFEIPNLNSVDFSNVDEFTYKDLLTGDCESGLQGVVIEGEMNSLFPAPHPDGRSTGTACRHLDIDSKDYWEVFGEDLIKSIE